MAQTRQSQSQWPNHAKVKAKVDANVDDANHAKVEIGVANHAKVEVNSLIMPKSKLMAQTRQSQIQNQRCQSCTPKLKLMAQSPIT